MYNSAYHGYLLLTIEILKLFLQRYRDSAEIADIPSREVQLQMTTDQLIDLAMTLQERAFT